MYYIHEKQHHATRSEPDPIAKIDFLVIFILLQLKSAPVLEYNHIINTLTWTQKWDRTFFRLKCLDVPNVF